MASGSRRVLIAGAGVGGLTAALALRSAGWEPEVCERDLDPQREAGTAFNLWGNAVTALDRIGVGSAVASAGDPIDRMQLLSHKGEQINETPVAAIGDRIGTFSVNIRRAELLRLLHDACKDADVPIHLGRAVVGYAPRPDGVALVLSDGTEVAGSAVIGADGARSAIRSQLFGDGPPEESSWPVRGISDVDPGVPAGTVQMVWGPRGGGAGCWPLGDGRVSWTIGTTSALRDRLTGDPRPALLDFVRDFPGPIAEVIRATPAERIVRSPVLIRREAGQWGRDRVTLLGDAAHAMPTVYSQGACQAIEDGVVLGEELGRAAGVEEGLRAYENRRRPRVDWLRDKVFMLDKFQKFENRLMCSFRNFMASRTPAEKSAGTWQDIMTFDRVPS